MKHRANKYDFISDKIEIIEENAFSFIPARGETRPREISREMPRISEISLE